MVASFTFLSHYPLGDHQLLRVVNFAFLSLYPLGESFVYPLGKEVERK
jgi:hypothetical protein